MIKPHTKKHMPQKAVILEKQIRIPAQDGFSLAATLFEASQSAARQQLSPLRQRLNNLITIPLQATWPGAV